MQSSLEFVFPPFSLLYPLSTIFLLRFKLLTTSIQLKSSTVAPPLSKAQGIHFIWPGLEPLSGDFVFQNVLGDQKRSGSCSFAAWYGPLPDGSYREFQQTVVSPGDSLVSDFVLDLGTNTWSNSWMPVPGNETKIETRKQSSESGNLTISFEPAPEFTDVIFEIELIIGAVWGFGPQVWENIFIEVNSTETSWCRVAILGQYGFNYSMTEPVVRVNANGTSSCYIATFVFENP